MRKTFLIACGLLSFNINAKEKPKQIEQLPEVNIIANVMRPIVENASLSVVMSLIEQGHTLAQTLRNLEAMHQDLQNNMNILPVLQQFMQQHAPQNSLSVVDELNQLQRVEGLQEQEQQQVPNIQQALLLFSVDPNDILA